jgi:hypothetical protein
MKSQTLKFPAHLKLVPASGNSLQSPALSFLRLQLLQCLDWSRLDRPVLHNGLGDVAGAVEGVEHMVEVEDAEAVEELLLWQLLSPNLSFLKSK